MQLQKHQQRVLDYFIENPKLRGLLIVHGTGSGKTLTAISITEKLRSYKEVIVLAPRSLHDNFKKDLGKYTHNNEDRMNRYIYISSNASNMINKLETSTDDISGVDVKSLDLNNKLIVCDEFHNLLVAMSNGSKNASALYDMIMKSKNCKLIFLTATPIINNYYEIIIGLNLCKGYIYGEDKEKLTLFPEDENTFNKYFVDSTTNELKNINKLRNRMFGLVSYYGDLYNHKVEDFFTDMRKTIKMEHFPDRLPIKVELVKMSAPQQVEYLAFREKERLESKNAIGGGNKYSDLKGLNFKISAGAITKSKSFSKSTSYRIKSRQCSNVYFPEDTTIDIYQKMDVYSPKISKIYENMNKENKIIIYSNFLKSGLETMGKYLEYKGYKQFTPQTKFEEGVKYYAYYTGDIKPDDRTATLKEYNKLDTQLKILLISSSGSEGLSLKACREVHIMEPYWNLERIKQILARAIRFHSHDELPEKERNVQICIYLSVYNHKPSKKDELPTDVYLFTASIKKHHINQDMMKLVASVAIDCKDSNKNLNFKCYDCDPKNGRPLFINQLDKDMVTPSPCQHTHEIKAKEFKLDGELYYIDENNNIYQRTESDEPEEEVFIKIIDPDVIQYVMSKMKV